MCVAATNTIRILAGVLLGAAIGFTPSASAQTALSGCTGQPIQVGKGSDPEKDTVGFICLSQDVNVTGSTVIRSQDGKWTIAPVGHPQTTLSAIRSVTCRSNRLPTGTYLGPYLFASLTEARSWCHAP